MADANISDKQRRFCEEYIIDFNGTQAAIRAGYSAKTAKEQSSQLLTKLNIQTYLAKLKQKAADESGITKKQLIDELAKIAFFDIRKIYTEDNALKDIHSFDDESAAALAGIETDDIFEFNPTTKQRFCIGQTKKVKIHNKIAAIERVSKMLGYDEPIKQETKVTGMVINYNNQPGNEPLSDDN